MELQFSIYMDGSATATQACWKQKKQDSSAVITLFNDEEKAVVKASDVRQHTFGKECKDVF